MSNRFNTQTEEQPSIQTISNSESTNWEKFVLVILNGSNPNNDYEYIKEKEVKEEDEETTNKQYENCIKYD